MWGGIGRLRGGRAALRYVIGGLALMMLPISVPMLWHPWGPPSTVRAVFYLAPSVVGVFLGLWWIRDRNPSLRHAIYFVAASEVLIVIGSSALGNPAARILGMTYLGMIAMLAAFLLGSRWLALHCAYAIAVIVTHIAIAVRIDGMSLVDLYVVIAPVLTVTVGLPAFIQALVVLARIGMSQVFTERNRDPVTGGYSRQGLNLAIRGLIHRERPRVAVVAALDLDGFKQFNDAHGHPEGDRKLAETARRLRAEIPAALVGRVGGDEFVVVALRGRIDEAEVVLERLRRVVGAVPGYDPINGSAGVVIVDRPDSALIDLARDEADAALYEAKRDRALRIVVREGLAGVNADTGAPPDLGHVSSDRR